MTTVLDQLPACTRACREAAGLSVEAAALEIGIPTSVLHGFENGTDSRMQTVKRVVAWLETRQETQTGRLVRIEVDPLDGPPVPPDEDLTDMELMAESIARDDGTYNAGWFVANSVPKLFTALRSTRSTVERLTERLLRLFQDSGPYRLGCWTRDATHADPCDCDPDGEWVGDQCMENSEWVYAVFAEEGDRLRAILMLPHLPPPPSDHDPMMAFDSNETRLIAELRDQLAGANDVIVGFLGAAAVQQFGTRRAQDVALCGCYIGPGSTGHSCGMGG